MLDQTINAEKMDQINDLPRLLELNEWTDVLEELHDFYIRKLIATSKRITTLNSNKQELLNDERIRLALTSAADGELLVNCQTAAEVSASLTLPSFNNSSERRY